MPAPWRLVVRRVHRGPATQFVPDEPEVRRNLVYIPDLARVVRASFGEAALRREDRGERPPETPAVCGGFTFDEGLKVVEEATGYPVHGESEESDTDELAEVDEVAILECLDIRVDADRFAEEVVIPFG